MHLEQKTSETLHMLMIPNSDSTGVALFTDLKLELTESK